MIPAADLATLYDVADGLAVQATAGMASAPVHFRQGDVPLFGGERIGADYTMRYRVSDFGMLARGDAVVIGGATYHVIEPPQLTPSGAERVARLRKA